MTTRAIAVIGATCPLGYALLMRLAAEGIAATATYRDERRIPVPLRNSPWVEWQRVDLEESLFWPAFRRFGDVIWLAHAAHRGPVDEQIERNAGPFEEFCAAVKPSQTRVIYVSSGGSVYGEPRAWPIREGHPRDPLSAYGMAKRVMEDTLSHCSRSYVILRPGNIYGSGSLTGQAMGVVGAFLRSFLNQEPVVMVGEGRAVRDFVAVEDVADAIVCALRTDQERTVWNVGTGVGTSITEVFQLVRAHFPERDLPFKHLPTPDSDVSINVLSTDRIRAEAGWEPRITLEVGVDALLDEPARLSAAQAQ